MAYNRSYNPDALPAHAEPEQVAQMMGAMSTGPPQQKPPRSSPQVHGGVPARVPVSSAPSSQHHYSASGARPLPSQQSYHSKPTPPMKNPYSAKPQPPPPTTQSRPNLHPSPPPQNYGFGPPPAQRTRPPQMSRPPQSPNPPPLSAPEDDPQQLFPLFRAANASHTGALTELELGSALVNGDFTSFHPRTVKTMIRMFDRNNSGTISFDEFVSLWRYLAAWRELFDRFDEDRSGRISLPEFEKALVAFGYRLSPSFVTVLFTTFESKGKLMSDPRKGPVQMGMSFDLFVQACISLRRMTDAFKRYDDDRDGYITVSFEEFLTEILQLQD
ncbi:EF-hand [Aspergillus campestris IBT 28561]|uniref:EF-hand n=1 Tax=Aspergillus campestris (strain IBT 28561) TaxID=1392248 RepID=A0A2I1DDV6_ASPC2|nr:EF-hand [Aspergillus campestris IBT 28561]PKY08036.1 EF-hand [Aspergillus campestris IBT 28561]